MQPLSSAHRSELLRVARAAVLAHVAGARLPVPDGSDEQLHRPAGVFVTIRVDGALRGCIGQPSSTGPLITAVMECAISSATEDPRFPAMAADEIAAARFEISVLSPTATLHDASLLRAGEHGVIVTRGRRRGLLLPQVAVEQGWSAVQLLEGVCLKAGLPPDAWRQPDTLLEFFTAEVFSDPP